MKNQFQVKERFKEPLTNIEVTFSNDKQKSQRYAQILKGLIMYMKKGKKAKKVSFLESKLFSEPGIYLHMTGGFNIQGQKVSQFTQNVIKGQPYTFEDGKTIVSQEEALEYALCNRFSPLANGFRINPF